MIPAHLLSDRETAQVVSDLQSQGILPRSPLTVPMPSVLLPRSPVRNIRISVLDLIIAARALCVLPTEGDLEGFTVIAAGHTWATLSLTEAQCRKLSDARIHWQPD